ncbi:unnamed protein product [Cuscuta epithymum]|uniref:Uncharacterized protein n=1 Tax=Cuscuta epithymum TaxID=186058 RepID=A0AAV0GGH2_9ASTE|nr:unnamed protein product [Cuscuta epithymum]
MGVQCLTRHNIASHLQKYRSHNKHLQAREAHLTRKWNRMPKMGRKRGIKPSWVSPPVGFFPPQTPHVSPLHVWGHPFLSQSLGHMWLNHLVAPSWSAPAAWSFAATPPPPQTDFSFWHSYNNECRRGAAVVSGTDHLPMYGLHPSCVGVPAAQTIPTPPLDSHPAKEMIDTAIGDVLSKPWLPLPVGLKPPSIDSIMKELQRHGISMVPTPRCRRV